MKEKVLSYRLSILMLWSFFICACTHPKVFLNSKKPAGRYINVTFLNEATNAKLGEIQPYCYEINFDSLDSARLNFGAAEEKVAIQSEGKLNRLLLPGGEGTLFYQNNKREVILVDSNYTGRHQNSVFLKVAPIKNQKWNLNTFLNGTLLKGKYCLANDENVKRQEVIITSAGSVVGLKDFVNYQICYSGDCLEETLVPANLVSFKNLKGEETMYSFEIAHLEKSISFYEISPAVLSIKGERRVLKKAFKLNLI